MDYKLPVSAEHLQIAIIWIAANALLPHPRNVRRHNRRQLVKLKATIEQYGFLVPVLIDEANTILAGHARVEVAKQESWIVPCVRVEGLDDGQKRGLMLAENKLHDLSDFDPELLSLELKALTDLGINLEIAFDTAEIDISIESLNKRPARTTDPDDAVPPIDAKAPAVTDVGNIWELGRHRLLCGNALDAVSYERLLAGQKADLIFTDPPYNVPVVGHVSGLGRQAHREFAMASGEMSDAEFGSFLNTFIGHLVHFSVDGSIHYLCMDPSRSTAKERSCVSPPMRSRTRSTSLATSSKRSLR